MSYTFDEARDDIRTLHNGVGVVVYKALANQSIADSTHTIVTFDTVERDDAGFYDSGVSTSRLTVPVGLDGWYIITFLIDFGSNATGSRIQRINKNGTDDLMFKRQASYAGGRYRNDAVTTAYLAAGDYLETLVWQDSGGSLTVIGDASRASTHFGMIRQ